MSTAPQQTEAPQPQASRRGRRIAAYLAAGFLLLVAIVVGGVAWYSSTSAFENRMRAIVIRELERSTGGRVELGAFRWKPSQLQFEADNLTIHGLEGPKEIPYAHLDRLVVRIKIISLFEPRIGLSYLGATHPVLHLIIYPNGTTNQPVPKVKSTSKKSVIDDIFDLAIDRTELTDGLAIVNQRRIPFQVTANDLKADVSYDQLRDHYLGNIAVDDIDLERGAAPGVRSKLALQFDSGRNQLQIAALSFSSGDSKLELSGKLSNFAHPRLQMTAAGDLDLRLLKPLTGIAGIERGTLHLDANGSGDAATFLVHGKARVANLAYRNSAVDIRGLTAQAALLLTEDQIQATGVKAQLASGGAVEGDLQILHWQMPANGGKTRVGVHSRRGAMAERNTEEQGTIHARLAGFSLPSILEMLAPPRYRDLGFDTALGGTAEAHWTGSISKLEGATNLRLAPYRRPLPGEVPVTGAIVGTYSQPAGIAQLTQLQINTPGTQLHAAGALGIYPATRNSQITASLVTHNLGEFDKTLLAIGLVSQVRRGARALPIELHGAAQFHGTIRGTVAAPDVKGHLDATNFDVAVNPPAATAQPAIAAASQPATAAPQQQTLHVDALHGDAEYAPGLISLQNATVTAGKTTIQASGQLRGHLLKNRKYAFDDSATIAANAAIRNAALGQLLPLAGENLPVTGTLNLHAQIGGTLGDLNGGGHLTVAGGEIYGEPYRSLNSDLHFAGRSLQATHLLFLQDGGEIDGSASYNLAARSFQFAAQGAHFDLAHIERLQNAKYPIGGRLAFVAHGSGTVAHPDLEANLHLTQLTLAQDATGSLDATLHTQNRQLLLQVNARLNQAQLGLNAQTQISDGYETKARLTIHQLDLNPLTRTFHLTGIASRSPFDATVTMQGPLQRPKEMSGDLHLSSLALSLQGVDVQSAAAIHARLEGGTLTLDPMQINGADTHLQAQGSIGLFGATRPIHFHTQGEVNLRIAQTFSKQISSSGEVTFDVDAGGTTARPSLNGQVKLANVNFALESYINGISRMNGTLVFNEGRLELQNVTAYSGGGQIQLTGFATYAAGIYTDITATAKDVRVRYPEGITSMVDAKLRLQGGVNTLLISGDAELTRFAMNSSVDFAALSASTNGISLPPNPDSFSNKIRMDIHITSAPSMDFQNSYAKLAGTVDLRVRGTVAQPTVLGQITVTEGQATFAGTTYQLQRGIIYFSNPIRIEPVIDLDATAQVESYNITIGLHGTTNKLTPVFRSSPPLSEQDIFSLLALGRTQEEQQIYSEEETQAGVNSTADALLGGAINATVSSRIQKLFGGGSVKIDPTYVSTTGNATARLTVEQQISKNATLTYATNVNSTADQLIQGQVNLTPKLSVLAVRDESGVFSLIFTIRHQYR